MGMHAHGELFWGYDLGDMTGPNFESIAPAWLYDPEDGPTDREWEDELAVRLGWTEATFPNHLDFNWDTRSHEQHPDYQAYNTARDEKRRILADSGLAVKLDTYGYSEGDTSWCVAMTPSQYSATYEAIPVPIGSSVPNDWPDQVRRFMALLDLPIPDCEPGWYLTSSYG